MKKGKVLMTNVLGFLKYGFVLAGGSYIYFRIINEVTYILDHNSISQDNVFQLFALMLYLALVVPALLVIAHKLHISFD